MELRRATAADVPAIVALVDAVSQASVASVNSVPEVLADWVAVFEADHARYPWIVASLDGAFAGFAKASSVGARTGYAWTTELTIYLTEAARGHGVAKPLYGKLIEVLTAQGYRQAWARITHPNPASERLHAHFGMRHVGTQERFAWKHGRWLDVTMWQGSLGVEEGPPGAVLPVDAVAEAAGI